MFKPQPDRNLNRNLTAAAYILTMVTLRKPLRFKPQQSVQAINLIIIEDIFMTKSMHYTLYEESLSQIYHNQFIIVAYSFKSSNGSNGLDLYD